MSEETSRQRSRKCKFYHLAASVGYSAHIAEIASIEPRKSCGLYGQQGELERKAVGRSSESEKNKVLVLVRGVEKQTESKTEFARRNENLQTDAFEYHLSDRTKEKK